jgi:serine/threonine protein kinase
MGCRSSNDRAQNPAEPSLSGYSFQKQLGTGSYGQVRACTELSTGTELAVKIVHLQKKKKVLQVQADTDSFRVKMAAREVDLWKECSGHRHIVTLVHFFMTEELAFFVMQRCAESLLDLFIVHPQSEVDLEVYYYQMLLALQHVHSKDIIHRDVKHANWLVSYEGDIQLADFGLAIRRELVPFADHKVAGSRYFMAPEMIRRENYGCGVDIWSLGVTIYVMTFGNFPYFIGPNEEVKSLEHSIRYNSPPPSFLPTADAPEPSAVMVLFIKELLEHDPRRRKSAKLCLKLEPVCRHNLPLNNMRSFLSSASKSSVFTPSLRHGASTVSIFSTFSNASKYSHRTGTSASLASNWQLASKTGSFLSEASNLSGASMANMMVYARRCVRELQPKPDQETQAVIDDMLKRIDPSTPVTQELATEAAVMAQNGVAELVDSPKTPMHGQVSGDTFLDVATEGPFPSTPMGGQGRNSRGQIVALATPRSPRSDASE